MQFLILVLALGLGLPLLAGWFANTQPKQVIRSARWGGILLLAGLGLFLLLTGRLAGLLAVLGAAFLWLQRLSPLLIQGLPWFLRWRRSRQTAAGPAPGGASRLRTRSLDMQLDHASGAMDGYVLRPGPAEGRSLASLPLPALLRLLFECRADDPDSARVLETYLDRRFGPDWAKQDPAGPRRTEMSEAEAYALLGLAAGASPAAVKAAHRRMMKRHHPDHGGTAEMAARLNAARDRLLGA
ncbi:hypothetical protein P409_07110 [Inquilinus limosus MP06]|uniref:J domain-containing protein n=1 Tax=Inquilinus limosus MP06 TaxID=1398085 RepID=A0A0A0DAC9_9PROT|nr:hypothetical protein P409_07110 [Inquilinus limosus MP06]